MFNVEVLTTQTSVEAISAEWNALAGGIPFRRWEWCNTWWNHYHEDHELFVVVVRDQQTCLGIAPLFRSRHESVGTVLRMLGEGEVCADYLSILAHPENAQRVGEALSHWFQDSSRRGVADQATAPHWDMMELDGMDSECPVLEAFLRQMHEDGFGVRCCSKVNTWRLSLQTSTDQHLASLSKPSRRKIRTAEKRFRSGDCHIHVAAGLHEFETMWDELIEMHQRRRNSLGEAGCFASFEFSDFITDVARQFFVADQLDLVQVSKDQWPIATELCFRGSDITFAYQIGIEPEALRENPGWLVNTAAINHARELGQSGFDWCRGDEEYKRRLGASPKPCLHCRIVPPRLRSQLWDAALTSGSTIKEWLKTGLHATGLRS